jgi:uncharacterized protein (DUF2252 family)
MKNTRTATTSIDGKDRSVDAASRPHSAAENATKPPRSREERYAAGKALRDRVPRAQHSEWSPARSRRDPIDMMLESSKGRINELIPIRYGRMMVSPFTFYRGTANIMAADLASTPVSGLQAQLCGDCHVLNFNAFATPERRVIFDLADFDETMPGPWEWDVKRLAASFLLAARSNGFSAADQRDAAQACVRSYREHMAEYAGMSALEVWYSSVDHTAVVEAARNETAAKRVKKRLKKAAARQVAHDDFPKLAAMEGRQYVIKDSPPLIYHHPSLDLASNRKHIQGGFARYREALADDRKTLLDRYQLVDVSLKVVGIGSVGTFCVVMLMMAGPDDPMFLQVKEAGPSVLEPYVGKSIYPNHGQRVVMGQRLMQSASDIFLGWTHGRGGRHFYVRQLRDLKIKPLVEAWDPLAMVDAAGLCGWTLARAHARSGDPAMIAGYLGKSDRFDKAVTRFSVTYADQVERDYSAFMQAIHKGRIEVVREGENEATSG